MNRWYGRVGYIETAEIRPGVWDTIITERYYYGDILRNKSQWKEQTNSTNSNLIINNSVSVLADAYAYEHFSAIKYVEFMGVLWNVSSAEVQSPRILLTIGDVYNGDEAETS